MELTKKCPNCGKKVLANAKKCKHCNEWFNTCSFCAEKIENNLKICPHCKEVLVKKERHGFITFWLWFGVICTVNATIVLIILIWLTDVLEQVPGLVWLTDVLEQVPGLDQFILLINICCMLGYMALLNWEKIGFWAVAIGQSIIASSTIFYETNLYGETGLFGWLILTLFCFIPNAGILYAILQLKRNAVSCWENLE